MNKLVSKFLAPYIIAGSALMYMAPVVKPFQQVSIPEHVSVKEFLTKDNSFKQAIAQSRSESDKLIKEAKANAGVIITKALNSNY